MSFQTRKVQKTGGSSYTISLPKAWIEEQRVEKNDTLGILIQPDGNLLITPQIDPEKIIKTKEIDVDKIDDGNFLFRILIGTYVMGYSRIKITSSKKFKPFIRDCITIFTQIAIGPEIIEESNNFILIKDLVDPREMPFEKTIRRMYILVQNMHENAIKAFKTGDKNLAEEVIKRDDDIDRLHWLVGRQSHIVLRDIILCQKLGITLEQASHFHQISRFLERTADHAVRIAKNALLIEHEKVGKELLESILVASKLARSLLDKSHKAMLQKNINIANENIESIKELIQATEKINLNLSTNTESSISIGYIIESIRRTGEYAGDISEIIINNLL